MNISYTSSEQIEVYRFPAIAALLIPAVALLTQAFLPTYFRVFAYFDLPLLVTIFFAVARRNPVSGLLTGCVIGLLQDSLTHQPIGLYGIAKTVVGYAASSLGVKIDVDNPGSRLLLTFGFYVLHQGIYYLVARGLVRQELGWSWSHEALAGVMNAVLAVAMFAALEKFRKRT